MKHHATKRKTQPAHSRLVKKWDGTPPIPFSGRSALQEPEAGQARSLRSLRACLDRDPADQDTRLELAELLLARGKYSEAIALLDAPESPLQSTQRDRSYWNALRTYAFACACLRRYADAQRLASDADAVFPDALDFHYLLAFVGHRTGDAALSLAHARAFLAARDRIEPGERPREFCGTVSQSHEVFNYLGTALEKQGDLDEAMAAYEDAIQARPSFDLAWINFIRVLQQVGRQADANAVLAKARQACPRSRLLTRLTKPPGGKASRRSRQTGRDPAAPTITLCMIVKNEQEYLPRCLASIKALADQIIVVDTGSTDRTVEIAQSFGAVVHHHAWEGNFSKARNISMGYADGDWILILDADEQIEAADIPLIKHTIAETTFRALSVSVYNYSAQKRMYTSFLPSIRMFRRDLGAYYEGIVHNQLRFPSEEGVLRVPVRINHYGYGLAPELMARKVARTKALLEQQLRENPDNGFAHFNLAQLLRGSEEALDPAVIDQVIFHAGRAVDLSDVDNPNERHVHLMALHQLVTAYFNKGDYPQADACAHRALAHKPGYLDAILSLGHIHSMDGRPDLARKYYLEYLDCQKAYNEHAEVDHVILLHLRSRHNALYGLGLVAEMQNNLHEAAQWYERCIAERDDYLDVHYRLGAAYLTWGQKEHALQEFSRELDLHPANTDARIARADLLDELPDGPGVGETLEEGLTLAPGDPRLLLRLARRDYCQRRYQDAIRRLDEISDPASFKYDVLRLRADALYETGRYIEAGDLYEQCRANNSGDLDLLNNLGNCRFHTGDFPSAAAIYRQIIDTGHAEKHAYRNLGVALASMGKTEDAIFALESHAAMDPDDVESAGFLGDLHYGRHDYVRAIDEYEKVIEHQPNRPDTLTRLGDCYLNRGAIAAALLGYERALQADPQYRPAWERVRNIRSFLLTRMDKSQLQPDEAAVTALGTESAPPEMPK